MSTREYHKFSDDVFIRQKKSEPISQLVKGKRCIFTDQKQMKFPLTLFLGPRVRWRCGHNADDLKTRDREEIESWQRISKSRLFRSLPEYEINFPCERIDFSTCGSMPQCLPVNGIVSGSVKWKIDNCCYFYKYIQSCIF